MANPTVDPKDNSFGGAILALLKALGAGISPGLANRPGQINDAVENGQLPQQPGVAPPQVAQPMAPRVPLGNQSPGLGNSF
jgi:hypothetical protein